MDPVGCGIGCVYALALAIPVAALGWAVGWVYEAYGLPYALATLGGGGTFLSVAGAMAAQLAKERG